MVGVPGSFGPRVAVPPETGGSSLPALCAGVTLLVCGLLLRPKANS